MAPSRRLSQRISEGDGIAIVVRVSDVESARIAEAQGAKALALDAQVDGVREATSLPLLWVGDGDHGDVDAVVIPPYRDVDDELEVVVEVRDDVELAIALEEADPEIFLLSPSRDRDADPRETVLELLPDVPAGKLAIARLGITTPDEVGELERAGFDAVLVGSSDDIAALVGDATPEV